MKTQNFPVLLEDGTTIEVPIATEIAEDKIPGILEGYVRARQRQKTPFESPKYGPTGATGTQVMQDQAASVLQGIPQAITGIPSMLRSGKDAFFDMLKGQGTGKAQEMIAGAAQPFTATARGAGALVSPNSVTAPSDQEFSQAAEGAGANLGGILAGEGMAKILPKIPLPEMPKIGIESGPISADLATRAAANRARALKPTTLEGQAVARKIAPELSERGMPGFLQSSIDKGVLGKLSESEKNLHATETRLLGEARPEYQVSRDAIITDIEKGIEKLYVRGTKATPYPEAVNALKDQMDRVKELPQFLDFDQAVEFRRGLDQAVKEGGGFKGTGTAAEKMTMKMKRGVADLFRAQLNELDPALKKANHEYSLNRDAADIVERRQLGNVGKPDAGIPGRGTLVDDLLAGWAGYAMGGPTGAAVAEGVNLARQLPGYSNMKGAAQQRLSDILKPAQRQPAGLIGEGVRQMPPPDTSGISVTTGPPLEGGDPYKPAVPGARSVPPTGAAKPVLIGVEMDAHTGKPSRFTYMDQTGEKFTTTTMQ